MVQKTSIQNYKSMEEFIDTNPNFEVKEAAKKLEILESFAL